MTMVHRRAAGIDIGASEHWVCIDPSLDARSTRRFGAFTDDLDTLVAWLVERGITTVAMEATGIYWRNLFLKLSAAGIEALLVDPRQTRNPRGRKTDMQDCQWIWQLHAHGLLTGAFVPGERSQALREYLRLRAKRVQELGVTLVEMQRALSGMNIKLQHVLSNIGGETGLGMIDAILGGERDPQVLARLRNYRCKADVATIARALTGTWREECLFQLREARKDYDHLSASIKACDVEVEKLLIGLLPQQPAEIAITPKRGTTRSEFGFAAQTLVGHITGVDLAAIDGIGPSTALQFMGEIGFDISPWASSDCFCAWLRLCPNPKKSGGKFLGNLPTSANRAAQILRNAAMGLDGKKSPLADFFRRLSHRRGRAIAITATAHRLARIIYAMLRDRSGFDRTKIARVITDKTKKRMLDSLQRRAAALGYAVTKAA